MSLLKKSAFKFFTAMAACAVGVAGHAVSIDFYTFTSVYTGDFAYASGFGAPSASVLVDKTVGDYYARTTLDISGSGDQVSILGSVNHKRSGVLNDYTNSSMVVDFTVNAAVSYDFSGGFDVTDIGNPSRVDLDFHLYDFTTSSYVVQNTQLSNSSANESFTAGGNGGDSTNVMTGNLSGFLIAGHQYQFQYESYLNADSANDGASATGFMRLDLGGGAVPDGGATALMLTTALAGCLAFWRKK